MFNMNKQRGKHMGDTGGLPGGERQEEEAGDVSEASGQHQGPHIHIHSHSKGHTVHILHPDGRHEKHEHQSGDAEGIASHVHTHIGGQDHGFSSGEEMENEHGYGSGV